MFVVLMMQLLKPNGRAAMVLPDGSITGGTGVNGRIIKKLLTERNLVCLVRVIANYLYDKVVLELRRK